MSIKLDIPETESLKPKIVIFGVGGAGGNAVNNMIKSNLEGVEFIAANTDAQSLKNSLASNVIQLGTEITKGLGAGSYPDRGKMAAEENIEEINSYLNDANMVFIAAGMGGGTGTGAAPVIAKLAREKDALVVGVVTKPFHFEGHYRMEIANKGIEELKKYVDTLIVIPNQNLFRIANENTTFESAFKMADDVLHAGVRGITDLITMPGLVNLDFADIRTIMTKMGKAMMGTGEAEGENRAIIACEAAISNPLLDDISIKGAKGVLVNMTGGPDMTLFEADQAVNSIKKEVDPNANIIFGSAFNENMKGKIRISVVATGIEDELHENKLGLKNDKLNNNIFEIKNKSQSSHKNETSTNIYNKNIFIEQDIEKDFEVTKIEEIDEDNFQPIKEYTKEANLNYNEDISKNPELKDFIENFATNEKKLVKNNIKTIDKTHDKVFTKSVEKTLDEINDDNAKNITENKIVQKNIKEKPTKDSSGFSLFSFMNSKNSKSASTFSSDEDSHLNDKNGSTDNEEEINFKSKFFSQPNLNDDKLKDLDEKYESINEDDILNVPAFFRRKK